MNLSLTTKFYEHFFSRSDILEMIEDWQNKLLSLDENAWNTPTEEEYDLMEEFIVGMLEWRNSL